MKYLILILCLFCLNSKAAYFASSTGIGNGSASAPWGLQMGLSNTVIKPGDTLFLKGGVYKGIYTSSLSGTIDKPIVIMSAPNEWAVIDGSLVGQSFKNKAVIVVNGAYTIWRDFEITNSDPERIITISGSNPIERRGEGIYVVGVGTKVINLIIHDVGQGISAWTPATNSEYYGNLVYNNGWYAPDRFHGHGIYTQNQTGTKTFGNNIVLNNFSYGIHAYAETGALRNFVLEDNVLFNGLQVLGGYTPLENVTLSRNLLNSRLQLGYSNRDNTNLTLKDNYFPQGISLQWWTNVIATGNTIFNKTLYSCASNFIFKGAPDVSTFNFDYNSYYWSYPGPSYPSDWSYCWKDVNDREDLYLRTQWQQSLGKDLHSTWTNVPAKSSSELLMVGNRMFVTKNKYDSRKATITIYNWNKDNIISLKLDSILSIGDTYELHNTQNYFGDVTGGIYDGALQISMNNHSSVKPIGYPDLIAPSTFPEFGNFILVKAKGVVNPDIPTTGKDTVYVPIYIHDTIKVTNVVHDPPLYIHDTIRINGAGVDTTGMVCNFLPIADAGKDITISTQNYTLQGKGTDKDGIITKYSWLQVSGPTAYLPSPLQANPTVTLWVAGTYVFELSVTDDKTGVGKDRVTVIRN